MHRALLLKHQKNSEYINLLLPSDAHSETEKYILKDLFRLVLSQFKKYHPSGNLKFNNLGIFYS